MQHTPWLWRTSCRDDPLDYKQLPHSSLYSGTARWGEGVPPGLTPRLTVPGYKAMSIPCPHTQSWGFSVRASAYVSRAALWRPRRNLEIVWVFEMMQHQADLLGIVHTHTQNTNTFSSPDCVSITFRSGPIIQSLRPALLPPSPLPSLHSSPLRTVIWQLVWCWTHCLGWVVQPSGRAPMTPGCLPPVELSDLQCTQIKTTEKHSSSVHLVPMVTCHTVKVAVQHVHVFLSTHFLEVQFWKFL